MTSKYIMGCKYTVVKAFMGLKKDLRDHDGIQFAIGKYRETTPCECEYYAYKELVDCFNFYPNDGDNRFFEVIIIGDYFVKGSKICTRKIIIEKEINLAEFLNGKFTDYNGTKMENFIAMGISLH